jgi:hypothetical protein
MKIETLQGIVDTDKMPDMDALVLEKTQELLDLCSNAGYRCVLATEQRSTSRLNVCFVSQSEQVAKEMLNCIENRFKQRYHK